MLYIIDENIDRLGGAERVVSILSNHFSENSNLVVVSLFSKNGGTFFKYNENIKKTYLIKYDSIYYKLPNVLKKVFLIFRIMAFSCRISKKDKVIFGRVPVAVKFTPFMKKKTKIVVRDAINIYDYSRITKMLMKLFFPRKVNNFIVSSNESMELYKELFKKSSVNMSKIYNPLGIDNTISNYKYDNKIIISNGRFDTQKGFENLIYACDIVFKKHNDWKLVLIGEGPLYNNYVEIINKCGINNNVIIKKTSKKIEEELVNSSIFVLTSRYEGYANSLVEALACGIPSISFNWLTGVEDIINDKVNGIIVKLSDRFSYFKGQDFQVDIENLAQSINYLIENPSILNKMSIEAVKISENRNLDYILKQWDVVVLDD